MYFVWCPISIFIAVLFSEMTLYNRCLISVVLNDTYKTDDLPHTIQDDVAVLQCFKNKLLEWNTMLDRIIEIQERIVDCHYRNCDCSIQIDCECEPYNDYEVIPGCELEVRRLKKEEEDLNEELNQLREEIMCIKDKIPIQLKNVVQKMVKKMDDEWLCFLSINLQ